MASTLRLTAEALREMFPSAPQEIIAAFVKNQAPLDQAGITNSKQRLAYFFANVGHETGGWIIKDLTENINYSHSRVAQVWPNRFASSSDVINRFGTGANWQLRAFDNIYGNRMGNRPGTSDGSRFIGRGGPQVTGRDGYREVGMRACLPLEEQPELACKPEHQPAICAAFWEWKGLNTLADDGKWEDVVRRWNGGFNGMADREARLARYRPIIDGLRDGPRVKPEDGGGVIVVIGGGAAAEAARQYGADIETIAFIAAGGLLLAVVSYFIIRRWLRRRKGA
jgi:putative chitinase